MQMSALQSCSVWPVSTELPVACRTQVDEVMGQRGQARHIAERFKRVDDDDERPRRPREMIVIDRAQGPSVLENDPTPCRPDVVRPDPTAELADIAAVERGTTRNLVASWKNKEFEQPSRQARTSCIRQKRRETPIHS